MPQCGDNSEPPPLTIPAIFPGHYSFPQFQGEATLTLSQWGVSMGIKNNPAPVRRERKMGRNDHPEVPPSSPLVPTPPSTRAPPPTSAQGDQRVDPQIRGKKGGGWTHLGEQRVASCWKDL